MANSQSNTQQEDIFSQDSNYALFVGKNFGYYSAIWYKVLNNKYSGSIEKLNIKRANAHSFNISACFFNILWLSYRKMYLKTFLFIVTLVILRIAFGLQFQWSAIIIAIILGFYGNWNYFTHTNKKIEKLKKGIVNPDILKSEIIRTGGTSAIAACITLVLICIMCVTLTPSFQHSFIKSYKATSFDNSSSVESSDSEEISIIDTYTDPSSTQNAPNCEDGNVMNVAKQLLNNIISKEISASIYVKELPNIQEKSYNPELNIRTCTGFAKFEGNWRTLQYQYPINDDGLMPIVFVVNNEMVKLGSTM